MQSVLTKIALFITGISLGLSGFWTFVFLLITIGASFLRDIGLSSRRMTRKLPSYGVIWILGYIALSILVGFMNAISGEHFLSGSALAACVGITCLFVRFVAISAEEGVELLFATILDPWLSQFGPPVNNTPNDPPSTPPNVAPVEPRK